jgi:ATP-dependent Lhr-like helicase
VLDLEHLEEVLRDIQRGAIQVLTIETVVPSPVASALLYDLIAQYMYEGDQPKAERQMQALMVGRETLSQVLNEATLPELLKPEAVRDVEAHLQHLSDTGRARTREELATLFLALGDLSAEEAAERCSGRGSARSRPAVPALPDEGGELLPAPSEDAWLAALVAEQRLIALDLPGGRRFVLAEHASTYRSAFDLPGPVTPVSAEDRDNARRAILRRILSTHGPLTRDWLLARYSWEAEWLDLALSSLVANGEVVTGHISPQGMAQSSAPEYCDRRNLERIHRATLTLLRREVEPVSLQAYADFLSRWQHLHPAHRQSGTAGLVRLLQQMRGVPVPGPLWERDLLPLRLDSFDPEDLDLLCERGELTWVGSGGREPQRARVRFLFRGEGNLFLAPEPAEPDLSPTAARIIQVLRSEGACFFADLEAGTDLPAADLSAALVELVMAGLVTNDSLQALRQVLASGGPAGSSERRPLSSLEAELAAWRETGGGREPVTVGRRPSRRSLHAARRTVADRMDRTARPRWPGRWSLVHRLGVWGRDVPFEERLERQARQLLQCYGVVTRKCLEGDAEGGWDWNALYPQFQLMEMRGEVRRGYFVRGLPGVQFALPEAVERLREWTQQDAPGSEDLVLLNACDPANLFGPAASDDGAAEDLDSRVNPSRFARIPSNYVVLSRGWPVLLLEIGAERVTVLPNLSPGLLQRALALVVEHVGRTVRRVTVAQWNGEAVLDSAAAPPLESAGFRREALVYVWEAG